MRIDLSGNLAVVTGASGGIGRATAILLAGCGAKVAVNYFRSKEGGDETVQRIREAGGHAAAFQADVGDVAQIEALVRGVESHFGATIDILVNNAGGISHMVAAGEVTEEYYQQTMDLNMKSCVFVSKAVMPGMIAKGGGRIINISSAAAYSGGGPGVVIYTAAKGAMLAYTKGLAKELAHDGIRVNAVAPGAIAETANDRFKTEENRRWLAAAIPLQREGVPADVANTVLFLASSLSDYLTGETIAVTGGLYMG